jgi:hypothetical protein
MKYTKQELKQLMSKKANKYEVQEFWKRKKNVALQKLSRRENKFDGYEFDHVEYEIYTIDLFDKQFGKELSKCESIIAQVEELETRRNQEVYPLGAGWD